MAIESIAKTLGTGSGIDIGALVENLVEAQFQNKNALLTKKNETLTTQISKLGELKSGIAGFATALSQLTANGALQTQPTSSNSNIVAVSRLLASEAEALARVTGDEDRFSVTVALPDAAADTADRAEAWIRWAVHNAGVRGRLSRRVDRRR